MSEDFYLVDVIEYRDGSCESVMGKEGTTEVFFVPSSEKTIARYKAVCGTCNKRNWPSVPKADRCDCDLFLDWGFNMSKKVKRVSK